MRNVYKVEPFSSGGEVGLTASPLIENMIHNFNKLLSQSEEDWWTWQVIDVLESKGFEVRRDRPTLADRVEAIKKYLNENNLPDMTKTAFLADLEEVKVLVK